MRRCCTNTSPKRNFSGRPGGGRGASGAPGAAVAIFMRVFPYAVCKK
jgi:hypothetical protein